MIFDPSEHPRDALGRFVESGTWHDPALGRLEKRLDRLDRAVRVLEARARVRGVGADRRHDPRPERPAGRGVKRA